MRLKIAVIILSWNSKKLIADCLQGLLKHEASEVYVVDNDSSDGSPEFISQNFPSVHLIRSPMNLGFAAGNNLGIRHALNAGFDAVFLLNNDTIIDEPFIEPCARIMEENSRIGVLGPVIVEGNEPEKIQCRGGNITLWNLGFPYIDPGEKYCREEKQIRVGYVLGAAMLIRREVLEKTQGLDPEYFPAYVEEADLCFRAGLLGYESVVYSGARVRHLGDRSSGGNDNSFRRYTSNRFLFGLKHLDPIRFFLAAQIMVLKVTVKKLLRAFGR